MLLVREWPKLVNDNASISVCQLENEPLISTIYIPNELVRISDYWRTRTPGGSNYDYKMVEQGEKYIHHILTKSVEDLCTTYEPNVFEHCASRWLRLVFPPVVETMSSLSLAAMTKSVYDLTDVNKAQHLATAAVRRKMIKEQSESGTLRGNVKPGAAPIGAGVTALSLTDQADLKFNVNLDEKKILRLCKKSGVRVTKIRDVIPDWNLDRMDYGVGILTQEGSMALNSFCVTSSTSSEACYYLPSEPPVHVRTECSDPSSENIYALPQSILIVQKMTTQAPKKWMLFRQTKAQPDKWLASELKDLRYTITKDNSMDASGNAPVILQLRQS